jgi:hypothetical protein
MSLARAVRRILFRVSMPAAVCAALTAPAGAAPVTTDSMRAEQRMLTEQALEVGRTLEIRLDFSHDSIKDVEEILGMIHGEYAISRDDEGLDGLALQFGAYIVTTIEKHSERGCWQPDDRDMGPSTFPFYWRGLTLFPYAWCKKRILDGPADNVWTKYRQFVVKKLSAPAKRDPTAGRSHGKPAAIAPRGR